MKKIILPVIILSLVSVSLRAEDAKEEKKAASPKIISAAEAKDHTDETLTVTGKVAQVTIREKMVYLNLDKPYPGSPLTGVIFASKTNLFTDLEKLKDKDVQLSGKITKFREQQEIIIDSTNQLKVVEKTAEPATPEKK